MTGLGCEVIVTQDCGINADPLILSGTGAMWRSHPELRICIHLMESGAVLWIRCGFIADPDPAFYLNADLDPGSQTDADSSGSGSGSWSDFEVPKL
jgi:hypothetical protein